MTGDELRMELRTGTQLVHDAAHGLLPFDKFLNKYGNFYYYNALDGHEAHASKQLVLEQHARICDLHKRVQTEIVDLVMPAGVDTDAYRAAGRITTNEGEVRLSALAAEFDIDRLLTQLSL